MGRGIKYWSSHSSESHCLKAKVQEHGGPWSHFLGADSDLALTSVCEISDELLDFSTAQLNEGSNNTSLIELL